MMALLARFGPHIAILLAVAGAAAWIDHRGYQRAKDDAAIEKAERERLAAAIVVVVRRKIDAELAELARGTNRKFQQIQTEDRNLVQPLIQRELARDPGLLSRICLTPQLLDAINLSRGRQDGQLGPASDQRTSSIRLP